MGKAAPARTHVLELTAPSPELSAVLRGPWGARQVGVVFLSQVGHRVGETAMKRLGG